MRVFNNPFTCFLKNYRIFPLCLTSDIYSFFFSRRFKMKLFHYRVKIQYFPDYYLLTTIKLSLFVVSS